MRTYLIAYDVAQTNTVKHAIATTMRELDVGSDEGAWRVDARKSRTGHSTASY